MDLAMAAHARIAERQLLTQIGCLATAVSGTASDLGATRVRLPLLDRSATAMRDRLQMPANAVVQPILADWKRGILRSDPALQEPGDATLGVTHAELMTHFATRSLSVTWVIPFGPDVPCRGWAAQWERSFGPIKLFSHARARERPPLASGLGDAREDRVLSP